MSYNPYDDRDYEDEEIPEEWKAKALAEKYQRMGKAIWSTGYGGYETKNSTIAPDGTEYMDM